MKVVFRPDSAMNALISHIEGEPVEAVDFVLSLEGALTPVVPMPEVREVMQTVRSRLDGGSQRWGRMDDAVSVPRFWLFAATRSNQVVAPQDYNWPSTPEERQAAFLRGEWGIIGPMDASGEVFNCPAVRLVGRLRGNNLAEALHFYEQDRKPNPLPSVFPESVDWRGYSPPVDWTRPQPAAPAAPVAPVAPVVPVPDDLAAAFEAIVVDTLDREVHFRRELRGEVAPIVEPEQDIAARQQHLVAVVTLLDKHLEAMFAQDGGLVRYVHRVLSQFPLDGSGFVSEVERARAIADSLVATTSVACRKPILQAAMERDIYLPHLGALQLPTGPMVGRNPVFVKDTGAAPIPTGLQDPVLQTLGQKT